MLMHRINVHVFLRGHYHISVFHFFSTPFVMHLALSEVGRELEHFRESDAYGKEGGGILVSLTVMSCTEMHTIAQS